MRPLLPIGIVAFVGLVAIGSGVLLYRANKPQVLSISTANAAAGKAEAVHVRGAANAAVMVEEFGDFQCPPCGVLSEPLNQLEHDYHNKLRLIFGIFRLPIISMRSRLPLRPKPLVYRGASGKCTI
ncbi:MAG: hypothetical protein DMF04_10495 [Verrucomicrobia bacterium]|nr:MAG: hypothetical protein DMF04_10495 [Verrucomicrobiota bacterium]